ncbi:MAG: CvpA family protein [Rickettsiales bacterium]|nr:MAG: CvpA family protein [Rickettsiales bacterium]
MITQTFNKNTFNKRESTIITEKLNNYTKGVTGGAIDRVFGLGFGFIRGYLFALLVFSIVIASSQIFIHSDDDDDKAPKWLKDAKTYDMLNMGSKFIKNILPKRMQKDIDKIGKYKNIENLIDKQQIINKITESLSEELDDSVYLKYLDKLKNENISESEKRKILELIKKLDKDNKIDKDTNNLIEKIIKKSEKEDE